MSNSLFQNSYYICVNVNAILYGIELVLYYLTMRQLLQRKSGKRTRSDKFFMGFSTALLFLITIYMSTEAIFGEEMWIVNFDFPGGADAWFAVNAAVWYQTMGTASFVFLNWLTDALMIYRCFIVWNDYRVIVVPIILYLATWALGIIELVVSGEPGGDFFVGKAEQLGLAYFSTTIRLNVLVTVLICVRILTYARRVEGTLGPSSTRTYTGAAALIIESALPYTLAGIAYLVSTGLNSGISILMGAFYGMFACISPQLLILRVLSGRVWTRTTTTVGPTTAFSGSRAVTASQITSANNSSDIALKDITKDRIYISTSTVQDSDYV
ncbi:hypothetical protein OBBRIDRAFT_738777 [Obba rivulosa]|uniref:Uncharacterized protein n=1 Tax=Obba rivulosa TaxID=1052685 RepID=A0A8E2AK77_9APHY|nr:hypothetical protein OBBRIDRAFT_738777 [Obba rivulosa]